MSLLELFILAVGLSMDAFAVAVCKGLGIVGLYFGGFQAGMPLIGYFLGLQFKDYIMSVDHWIAFILLSFLGIKMIQEALSKEDDEDEKQDEKEMLSFKNMSVLAIATSIDALAVGITLAFLQVDIVPAVSFIGITTFVLSIIGVKIGNVFGIKYKSKAEFVGGIILIFMGVKILLEHLGIIG